MLVELSIRNFAIIEAVEIHFGPGLNVLTGETGAGKSILIDALGAVLGDRVSTDMVRTGTRSASIDATFDLGHMVNRDSVTRLLAELEIENDDEVLILSREIQSGGRSGARLNGRPTTAAILTQVGSQLVDIHGQSDHLSLLRPSAQLELLDRFAKVTAMRDTFAKSLAALRSARSAMAETTSGARERMQRVDFLRFQVDEIDRSNLHVNEDVDLEAERGRLANADRLARDAATAYAALAGEDDTSLNSAALTALRRTAQTFAELGQIDPATATVAASASELLYLAEDLASEIRSYRDGIESDPARLEDVEERLAEIRQLKRKYGADIDSILEYARTAQAELERLNGAESDAEALAAQEVELANAVGRLAGELSNQRAIAASALAADVERAIARLNMGNAAFAVTLDRVEDQNGIPVAEENGSAKRFVTDNSGVDRVAFMIAPNPGEGLKPLSRIASGGETARLMLALKSILSEVDQTPTLVFDEIDVGVGGRSGQVVGETLWGLTREHQVIVITHLPQIAAFADAHFQIAKTEHDGRVISTINELEPSSRIEELAAMLDGMPVSETSLRNAEAMLDRTAAAKTASQSQR